VLAVLVDIVERLVVEIVDLRRVVRCPHCGFKTIGVYDARRLVMLLNVTGRTMPRSSRTGAPMSRRLARQAIRDVNGLYATNGGLRPLILVVM
jgi:hypothetical protein